MDRNSETRSGLGFFGGLASSWFRLTGRKIRLLQAGDLDTGGPELFVVGHPPGLLPSIAISLAFHGSVRCALPKRCAASGFGAMLARHLGVIVYEGDFPLGSENRNAALEVLTNGGSLALFIDPSEFEEAEASIAASLVMDAEAQLGNRPIPIYPLNLYLPESNSPSREIILYLDAPVARAATAASEAETTVLATQITARFDGNAFQLRPTDVEYFLSDLETVLRANLQEDWASRPDWKQDPDGFVLSRYTSEGLRRMNHLHPDRLVGLRESLDHYRGLQRKCALRELEVGGDENPLGRGWSRAFAGFETVAGFPIALYGFLNHCAIALVLFLSGSFKRNRSRSGTAEFILRASIVVSFYVLQTYLVSRHWGRAAAGYYAPSLPISGWYFWRYAGLIRPKARLLLLALTIPSLQRKIHRLRQTLLSDLDRAVAPIEE